MIGFDYGTSNCAVGVMHNNQPTMVELGKHGRYMSSTLYAPAREVIVHWLHQQLDTTQQHEFAQVRQSQLFQAQTIQRELIYDGISTELSFGQAALNQYLDDPDEGYYIKSPKSFLGASGLAPNQVALFEDIVAAMMLHVKSLTEQKLQRTITETVIGRPVNFQGVNGEKSNQQAINILTNAAKRVGFKSVEFLYEPVAAGFEFEASLTAQKKVLVVDIGGGTTDCSMMLMSKEFSQLNDRTSHMLGHCGQRIGGNDFDIRLALKGIMPALGMDRLLKNGQPMPANCFADAVAINNLVAQTDFYSGANGRFLGQLCRDAQEPEMVRRLLKVHQHKLTYQIVNCAEQAKIGLSTRSPHPIGLGFLEQDLMVNVDTELLNSANAQFLRQLVKLMDQVVAQAQTEPDIVFVTGGTAQIPILQQTIAARFPASELVIGDHFGSVTSGLTRWANRIFS